MRRLSLKGRGLGLVCKFGIVKIYPKSKECIKKDISVFDQKLSLLSQKLSLLSHFWILERNIR
jgi:hypothetical protein